MYVPSSTSASICIMIPRSVNVNNELTLLWRGCAERPRNYLKSFSGLELESQGQNPALNVLHAPHSLGGRRCARRGGGGGGRCMSPATQALQSVDGSLRYLVCIVWQVVRPRASASTSVQFLVLAPVHCLGRCFAHQVHIILTEWFFE